MKMPSYRIRRTLLICTAALFVIVVLATQFQRAYSTLVGSEKPIDTVLAEVEARREALFTDSELPETEKGIIHVLVLGLDARKGSDNPHCDAIHMFALNTNDWSVDITSVPRGTYSPLPPGQPHVPTDYYVSNACGFGGLEYGIEQIERIVGVHSDYYVTIGFSQVYGILRTFELPTTQSLQWLRHRQSYQIGDPQRSHNQAIFMKDLLTQHADRLRQPSAQTIMFLLYNMIDTNMDFGTAKALAQGYLESNIDERPESIRLSMKPYHPVVDYHFNFEDPDPQIQALLDRIRPYLSSDDLSDKDLEEYQREVVEFLEDELQTTEGIEGVVHKELWLQIEDTALRVGYHYRYTEAHVQILLEKGDQEMAEKKITDFILEYTALENDEMVEKGRALLRRVLQ